MSSFQECAGAESRERYGSDEELEKEEKGKGEEEEEEEEEEDNGFSDWNEEEGKW